MAENLPPQDQTRAVYDQIAVEYLAHWQNRDGIKPMIDRFARRLPAGARVIDVGCGPGFDTVTLRGRGLRAIGLDYSAGMLAAGRARHPVPLVQGDMRRLPVPDHSIAGLWVLASLLHLPRAEVPATLQEFHRVLRPGGVLLLSVKAGTGEGWQEDTDRPGRGRFFTFWAAEELDKQLHSAGFAIREQWENETAPARWLGWLAETNLRFP